jgi:hypothetical protein
MNRNMVKTGATLGGARLAARISENHAANLPNDLGKSWRRKNNGRLR